MMKNFFVCLLGLAGVCLFGAIMFFWGIHFAPEKISMIAIGDHKTNQVICLDLDECVVKFKDDVVLGKIKVYTNDTEHYGVHQTVDGVMFIDLNTDKK